MLIVLPAALVIFILSCNSKQKQGERIARKYCSACHQFPDPVLLDKKTWANYVLPAMASMLGFRQLPSGGYVEFRNEEKLTLAEWKKLMNYYLSNSPDRLSKPAPVPINSIGQQFEIKEPYTFLKPSTTFVGTESNGMGFQFGDGLSAKLYTSNQEGYLSDSLEAEKGIVQVRKKGKENINDTAGMQILSMGVLYPSDELKGKLVFINSITRMKSVLIDSLQRPVHASFTDLNNDGLEDVVVAEFGNTQGKLSWYQQLATGRYLQHILRPFPGAVKTFTGDYNGDKRPDILCLMAQGNESVFIYYNQGNGRFQEEQLIQFPPSYGSNSMDLADMNQDGFDDLIISNGDNGDYPPLMKPYHGIRIFLNDGHFHFSEKAFLPVNGIGKVMSRDFDEDGDLDLVSIAYFPDFDNKPQEGFIYWQNNGGLSFNAFSFDKVSDGRWLTMDAGDIDGDGDIDIILGNAYFTLGYIPGRLKKKWDAGSPAVLLLKNNLR